MDSNLSENLDKNKENVYTIPKTGKMKVPGRIYSSPALLTQTGMENALQQVVNVAKLPGIVDASLAMPDIHWGYGFPIGGVAAFSTEEEENGMGVISPGGVGFDINCGVRLLKTELNERDVREKLPQIMSELYKNVPAGLGSKGRIKLSKGELENVLNEGAKWAMDNGYLWNKDLEFLEENGRMENVKIEEVSEKAKKRGIPQLGSLGSGNHFLEIQKVEEIYDEYTAKSYGLEKDKVVVMMHCGSRGCGHQVCQDHIKPVINASIREKIELQDKQLASAPLDSKEAENYIGAMNAAANYAWANRSLIAHWTRESFSNVFKEEAETLGMETIYDVSHNIAKFEKHNGKNVCVHRKGATRAFAPNSVDIPQRYRDVGQPVLIPGDMGTCSYVLAGSEGAMKETFGSTCHGAGRALSRKAASNKFNGEKLIERLWKKNKVYVKARSPRVVSEEAPEAYKNVTDIVDVCEKVGISRKVAKLKPIGVIKG